MKLIIRENYDQGFIASLRNSSNKEVEEIKTRSLEYLRKIARNNGAEIIPKRFK